MKKLALIFSLIAIFSVSAQAQNANDAKDALGTVNKLFEMMAAHKPAEIIALHTPESQLVAIIKNKEGKSKTQVFNADAFSKMFAEKRGEIKEDMYAPETKIYGDLALVWGRYVFFINGKISHCGVNAFHLVRTDAGWKIANSSSTIEPQGCTEREKAMKTGTTTTTTTTGQ
jgi:hypothetical protein